MRTRQERSIPKRHARRNASTRPPGWSRTFDDLCGSTPRVLAGAVGEDVHGHCWYSSHVRAVAQPGSAPEWGSGGRRFKSSRPDQERGLSQSRERPFSCRRVFFRISWKTPRTSPLRADRIVRPGRGLLPLAAQLGGGTNSPTFVERTRLVTRRGRPSPRHGQDGRNGTRGGLLLPLRSQRCGVGRG